MPQEVVRRILDHDSPQMTPHCARLHDTVSGHPAGDHDGVGATSPSRPAQIRDPPDFGDPGIDTELGHQAVDLAGGDTVHVPLRHHQRAAREITAFADFPETRWRKVWSTSPPERLNKGGQASHRRRRDPLEHRCLAATLSRCPGEAHDECPVTDRRYLSEASMAQLGLTRADHPAKPGHQEVR